MKRTYFPTLLFLSAALFVSTPAVSQEAELTVEALEQQGRTSLPSAALEKLVVGRTLNVMSLTDDTFYEIVFFGDGYRLLRDPKKAPGGEAGREGIATWEVVSGRLVTRIDGSIFDVRIYEADGRYLAAEENGGGAFAWEVFPRAGEPVQPFLTTTALGQAGIQPLDDDALRSLVVDKSLVVRRRDSGVRYRMRFRSDGMREAENSKTGAAEEPLGYEIVNGWINTGLEGMDYRVRVYQVGDDYLAANSAEGSAVNWQIVSR